MSSWMNRLSPEMPVRLSIHAVTVVPMFAPIITLIAWRRVIMPEFTKPTTITVVAEDDCITAVTARPSMRPFMGLLVREASIFLRRLPARFSRALPIMFMPNRNSDRPPMRDKTLKMVILL